MPRLHILGASGSGTSTLAAALCARHGWKHVDTDDIFWLATDPPCAEIRPREERVTLMQAALDGARDWIVSGSMCGWGDVFIPRFDQVVFLVVPSEIRLKRLTAREAGRYGLEAIAPGGRNHEQFIEFMAWTAQYDDGAPTMRSRALHEEWLAKLPCPVLRLEGLQPAEQSVRAVEAALADNSPPIG
jgi:adenylate kinase family enzyme